MPENTWDNGGILGEEAHTTCYLRLEENFKLVFVFPPLPLSLQASICFPLCFFHFKLVLVFLLCFFHFKLMQWFTDHLPTREGQYSLGLNKLMTEVLYFMHGAYGPQIISPLFLNDRSIVLHYARHEITRDIWALFLMMSQKYYFTSGIKTMDDISHLHYF